jgi:hypothetical protein
MTHKNNYSLIEDLVDQDLMQLLDLSAFSSIT